MAINGGLSVPPELTVNVERYAVYRCYGDDGQLLYVGETGELGNRFASHARKLWFTQVRGITLEWYADELSALNAERRAIHVEHPKYNVQHKELKSLAPLPPPSPRRTTRAQQGKDKVADMIKRHPDWDNARIAERAGVHVRTVRRRRVALSALA
jgi:hypothetical protein